MRTKLGAAVGGVAVKQLKSHTTFQDGERVDVCPLNTTRDAA